MGIGSHTDLHPCRVRGTGGTQARLPSAQDAARVEGPSDGPPASFMSKTPHEALVSRGPCQQVSQADWKAPPGASQGPLMRRPLEAASRGPLLEADKSGAAQPGRVALSLHVGDARGDERCQRPCQQAQMKRLSSFVLREQGQHAGSQSNPQRFPDRCKKTKAMGA
jgi:hypothetical protein